METYTLRNPNGIRATVTTIGARIMSLYVPDGNNIPRDIVLGFDSPDDYLPENHLSDFGAAIGRYANRIRDGRFVIDGRVIQLPQNNFTHCLHGGPRGWQYSLFDVTELSDSHIQLTLKSPDGDSNFPGTVTASVTYTLTDDNALRIDYNATSDSPTVINMTNHSYFNLNGDPRTTILNHILQIDADRYTPNDKTYVPVGTIEPVEGTPMDFRTPKPVGQDIDQPFTQLIYGNGYDHNWVLNTRGKLDTPCATLSSPATGIRMQVYTTEPGIQIYTGNFLDGTVIGKRGIAYQQRSAICLETQKFPDSPNHEWPHSNPRLTPARPYRSTTIFKFSL